MPSASRSTAASEPFDSPPGAKGGARREASAGTTNANRVAERRAELERLAEGAIHLSQHGTGDGKEFYAAADRLEGMVSKRAVLYRIGRARAV